MAHADYSPCDLTENRSQSDSPYLSIVAASRNDDHGGDPLVRTQIFINNFARQCHRYKLPAELILIDWNPVQDRPGLAAVLTVPPKTTYCETRVITVPTLLHRRLKYADRLPFFQMIAKNVGIRRARGRFILATNIDILFSDELMQFIARQKLDAEKVYRVDRYDIRAGLSVERTSDECMEYAWANVIRANRRYQPGDLIEDLYRGELFRRSCVPSPPFRTPRNGVDIVEEDGVWQVRPDRGVAMTHLHTNACGDFTLLSREGWQAIRGYPEFEAFSFNIDSMAFVAAHYAGYHEVSLLPPCVSFHIEHGIGSGWTPEGEAKLFDRLRQEQILNPEWSVLNPLVDEMRKHRRALEFNHSGWGMADFDLYERPIGSLAECSVEAQSQLSAIAEQRRISALQSQYDLDRLTLAHERRALEALLASQKVVELVRDSSLGATVDAESQKIVLYVPDSSGGYSEVRTIVHQANLINQTTLIFRVEEFAQQFPLRFDPCECPGLISIDSFVIVDAGNHRLVWELDGRDASAVMVGGTAVLMNGNAGTNGYRRPSFLRGYRRDYHKSFRLISTGLDPQIVLPRLSDDVKFPLIVTVEMKLLPCK